MRQAICHVGALSGLGLLIGGCGMPPESRTQEPIIIEVPSTCDCDLEETGMCPAAAPGEPLNTHMFERGALRLREVSDASLEAFMQDLNRRKDHAIACMHGGASADSEYLWFWLTRVCDELQTRGYGFEHGGIFRGGREVALR